MTRQLGRILVDMGFIDDGQLEMLVEEHAQQPSVQIGKVAEDMGLVIDTQLVQALAEQFDLQIVDFDNISIAEEILDEISDAMAQMYRAVPVHLNGNLLTIAVSHPENITVADELRTFLGRDIQLVVCTELEIDNMLEEFYGAKRETTERIVADDNELKQIEARTNGSESIPTLTKMDYMHSYTHVFERDDWFVNLLMGCLCLFIPVIGNLILMGYQYQVIEGFIRRPNAKLTKFNFSEFTQMLSRGVYPFVVSLILQFLIVPVFIIIALVAMVIPAMFDRGEQPLAMMLVGIFFAFATIIGLLVLHLIIGPLMLRAGLSQSFGETFDIKWIRSFVKMMWIEEIMSLFFLMFSSLVVMGIGMLLCFVGMYPAAILVMLAMSHLSYQQYAIFLANGGEPIPLKEEAPCYPVEHRQ